MTQSESISCPHCGQVFTVAPGQATQYFGQTITCTRCSQPFTVGSTLQPPLQTPLPSPVVPSYAQSAGNPQRTSRLAITALILGIVSFVIPLLASIGAIVCGIIGITHTGPGKSKGRGLAICGLCLGGVSLIMMPILLILISILLPALNRAREAANRIKCASNLKQIGLACLMYSNEEKDGALPDTVEHLLVRGDLSSEVFVCPSTSDRPSAARTPQTIAVDLGSGGHDSYIYIGSGLTSRATADTVVAYEPIANHRSEGCNMLFGDGHVDFIRRMQAQQVITELHAGQNPPPSIVNSLAR